MSVQGGLPGGGGLPRGGICLGGVCLGGVSAWDGVSAQAGGVCQTHPL